MISRRMKNSRAGFSIIQILIFLAVTGIIALAMLNPKQETFDVNRVAATRALAASLHRVMSDVMATGQTHKITINSDSGEVRAFNTTTFADERIFDMSEYRGVQFDNIEWLEEIPEIFIAFFQPDGTISEPLGGAPYLGKRDIDVLSGLMTPSQAVSKVETFGAAGTIHALISGDSFEGYTTTDLSVVTEPPTF